MSEIKLFDRWDTQGIEVLDPGLKNYIDLTPRLVPFSYGRNTQQFHRSKMHIVERFMNHLYVPGHRHRKHLISSSYCTGKSSAVWKIMVNTLEIIEKKTNKNPVEVLVRSIENAALREEITSFQVGGIIVRKAVITGPQRRIDLALRIMTQSAYQKCKKGKKKMADHVADEILASYNNDPQKSVAIREKIRIEKEAAGAR